MHRSCLGKFAQTYVFTLVSIHIDLTTQPPMQTPLTSVPSPSLGSPMVCPHPRDLPGPLPALVHQGTYEAGRNGAAALHVATARSDGHQTCAAAQLRCVPAATVGSCEQLMSDLVGSCLAVVGSCWIMSFACCCSFASELI